MKSIDKRVRELRRAVEGVLNTYGLPLSIADPEEAENGKPKQS